MNNETLNMQDVTFEIKKIIEDIDNVTLNVDLYAAFVDEKVMVE